MTDKTVEVKIHVPQSLGHPLEILAKVEFPLPDGRDLVQGPLTYNASGLTTAHNCDFILDPLFAESYKLGMNSGHRFGKELHIEWRVYICCWAANFAKSLPGDFVECGVNTGIFARAISHYVDFKKLAAKKFYLLDTFQGVPPEQWTEEEKEVGLDDINQYYEDCYENVRTYFRDFPNVKIIRGKIPETLTRVGSEEVAFLSIDLNCAYPEVAALEHFWPKLTRGGIVVLDDYGFSRHATQKKALDSFAKGAGIQILSLPTGQGLILKNLS